LECDFLTVDTLLFLKCFYALFCSIGSSIWDPQATTLETLRYVKNVQARAAQLASCQ
jgi:hypothetical protein